MKVSWLHCTKWLCLNFIEDRALTKCLQGLVPLSKDIKYRGESFLPCLNFPKNQSLSQLTFRKWLSIEMQRQRGIEEKVLELARKLRMKALLCFNQVSSDVHVNLSEPQFPCLPVAVVTSPSVAVITPPPTKVGWENTL